MDALACTLLGALFAVEHISPGDLVVSAAHEAKFDLVLHIFNMKGAAARTRTHQGTDHGLGQAVNGFANTG